MGLGELSNWHKGRFTVIAVGILGTYMYEYTRNLVITRTMEFPLLHVYQVLKKTKKYKEQRPGKSPCYKKGLLCTCISNLFKGVVQWWFRILDNL